MPVCKKCSSIFPNRVKIDGKVHVLCHRVYCLDCSPFGSKNRKKLCDDERVLICQTCGKKFARSGASSFCRNCKRRERKNEIIAYKGGKCELCGYNKCKRSLTLHHLDPCSKQFGISGSHCRKWSNVKSELDKCVLVCMNCHMEIEDGETMLEFDRVIEKFQKKELDVSRWNFCIHREGGGKCGAYIMGEGAEQCLASKHGFNSEQEVIDLYKALGVTRWLPI